MLVKYCIAFLAYCAVSMAHGGGGSGEHGGGGFGCSCLVVDSTTTNCTGASGKSCSDSTSLLALVAAGKTSVPVCSSPSQAPITQTIQFHLQVCKRCTCFTAPTTELRNCTTLNGDSTFPKSSCFDQTNLANLAKTGTQARVCGFDRYGNLAQTSTVNILAAVGGGYY